MPPDPPKTINFPLMERITVAEGDWFTISKKTKC
jgi:hypothetical protein